MAGTAILPLRPVHRRLLLFAINPHPVRAAVRHREGPICTRPASRYSHINAPRFTPAIVMKDLQQPTDAPVAATTDTALPAAPCPPPPTVGEAPAKRARSDVDADAGPDDSLQVLRVHADAKLPTRGTVDSAGFDLSASEAATIVAGGRSIVKTGLKIKVPRGCYGRVAPRSGLAVKKGIDVGAGVIDADYRGEVGVVLFNFGAEDFQVNIGDRVAQLVLERICMADVLEVEGLDETVRGAGGFGSTGVAK